MAWAYRSFPATITLFNLRGIFAKGKFGFLFIRSIGICAVLQVPVMIVAFGRTKDAIMVQSIYRQQTKVFLQTDLVNLPFTG